MKILGVLRGFPGLGRVVAGVSLMETLSQKYNCDTKIISYLQGNKYLETLGYEGLIEATPFDYCSIGLLPTNKMGASIHDTIRKFNPDIIIVDGEPLMLQSIKLSHKNIKVVALLNPSDVDNPNNDKETMDYFNALYSIADLAICHGLRKVTPPTKYSNFLSVGTILRREIIDTKNVPSNNIYCLLGGGTINVDEQFSESTITIGRHCLTIARNLPEYNIHGACSSKNIYDSLKQFDIPHNVFLYNQVVDSPKCYSDACLVITRSGRNTLSELAYLGIPSISFVSGCSYRHFEQKQNIASLSNANIAMAPLNIEPDKLTEICLNMMAKGIKKHLFEYGNDIALKSILSLKDEQ